MLSFHREQAGKAPRSLRGQLQGRLQALAKDADRIRAARRRLVDAGCAESLVQRFPPLQVILLDEKREYEVQRDERIKLLALPLWQIDSLAGGQERERGGDGLFADLLPHIIKLRRARGQLEQQIALLRHVEALRLYAAGTTASCPRRLSDIPVPCPSTRSPASRSTTRSRGRPPTSAASSPSGEEKDRASATSITR